MEHIKDHLERMRDRIISQWKNDTNLDTIIESLGIQKQEEEDMFQTFFSRLNIDAMIGKQLDGIGDIVGEPRDSKDDILYRRFLKARIGRNLSSGTIADVTAVWKILIPDYTVHLIENYPCEVELQTDATLTAPEWEFIKSFDDILTAGVRLAGVVSFQDNAFAFFEDPANPNTGGFGDLDDLSVGGELASFI